KAELLRAVEQVIDRGLYILGPEVAAFEAELAQRTGTEQAVGVGSGTDALRLALLAGGVGPGDEVIAPSHTAGPTVAAIHATGAVPVLVEVDPETACIDPERAEQAIGARTRALIAVHLYGHPADMGALSALAARKGLLLIEDCAQAQGATIDGRTVGSIGDFGCFSFYPTKNLGALGDGGAITGNAAWMERARALRTYGWTAPQYAEYPHGVCSRLDELQAALLRVKLGVLERDIDARRAIVGHYREALAGLPVGLPSERSGCRHVYHLYVIRTDRRDALREHLAAQGIATGVHYPYPVHLQPGLAAAARIPYPLTATERLCTEILTLPLYATLTDTQVERVAAAVRSFFA
ncbi:MAG TPA: DegT/DnrJ/EryC1/StrS family aminotransferase, partial [bacterium]|nr:DegT/DnrJ/EryC1/StrS family aminotransferase [bacterium]